MTEKALSPRQVARQYAVRGLYQWQLNKVPSESIVAFQRSIGMSDDNAADLAYMHTLISGTIAMQETIDEGLLKHLSRPVADVDPVELSILRVASYELIEEVSVPYSVILNEAIELAKYFSNAKSHQFINGVLDKAGRQWRPQNSS